MEPRGTSVVRLGGSDTDPFHVTWKEQPLRWDANTEDLRRSIL